MNWIGWTLDSRSVSARLGDYSMVFPSQRIKVPSAQFADVTRKSIGEVLTADWSGRSSPVTCRRISRIVRPGNERLIVICVGTLPENGNFRRIAHSASWASHANCTCSSARNIQRAHVGTHVPNAPLVFR